MNRTIAKKAQNLLGISICTLFLGYGASNPANATLVGQNIEALTKNIEWDYGDCVHAGGYCCMNGVEHLGVSMTPDRK